MLSGARGFAISDTTTMFPIQPYGSTHSRYPGIQTLWHANAGYSFDLGSPLSVSVQTGNKTGNWSTLGISTQPLSNVDMFAAWIEQPRGQASFAYKIFPATDRPGFRRTVDAKTDPRTTYGGSSPVPRTISTEEPTSCSDHGQRRGSGIEVLVP